MGVPISMIIKLLLNPDVSNKMILQVAYGQISAIGLSKILSALLSSTIVGVSSVIKVPQIKKILNKNGIQARIDVSKGLSLGSINSELASQLIHLSFNARTGNSFINYGETALLGIQNVIIKFLISYYRLKDELTRTNLSDEEKRRISLVTMFRDLAINLAILLIVLGGLPLNVIYALQVFNIPLSVHGKALQIHRNHQLKSTSHLSQVTLTANVLGSISRIFTSRQNKERPILQFGYFVSGIFNSILLGQCFYYKQIDKSELEKKNE